MKVTVNGEQQELPSSTSVAGLIERLGLGKSACAVEVNKRLVPKREHAEQGLSEGDCVELVVLVGGG